MKRTSEQSASPAAPNAMVNVIKGVDHEASVPGVPEASQKKRDLKV